MPPVVIIPTYNERENLEAIVTAVLAQGAHALVVDDASPDGTGELAEALKSQYPGRVDVLHRHGPRGFGRASLEGMQMALRSSCTLICQMDADGSHDPAHLPALFEAANTADLVVGSRYVPGGAARNWPRRRRLLSAGVNWYVRAVTGLSTRDCTAGYRCWRRETLLAIDRAAIRAEGYAFQVEMLYATVRRGLRVVEVPITFVERRAGQSKMSRRVILESLIAPWRLVLGGRV